MAISTLRRPHRLRHHVAVVGRRVASVKESCGFAEMKELFRIFAKK